MKDKNQHYFSRTPLKKYYVLLQGDVHYCQEVCGFIVTPLRTKNRIFETVTLQSKKLL